MNAKVLFSIHQLFAHFALVQIAKTNGQIFAISLGNWQTVFESIFAQFSNTKSRIRLLFPSIHRFHPLSIIMRKVAEMAIPPMMTFSAFLNLIKTMMQSLVRNFTATRNLMKIVNSGNKKKLGHFTVGFMLYKKFENQHKIVNSTYQ